MGAGRYPRITTAWCAVPGRLCSAELSHRPNVLAMPFNPPCPWADEKLGLNALAGRFRHTRFCCAIERRFERAICFPPLRRGGQGG